MSGEQTFHRYRLVRRIARGGMAEVYLAVLRGPAGFEKRVALKKILPVYAGMEEFSKLFKDEARLTGALDHTAVVQVHEFGTYEGEFYIAMEYVDGPDLEELLDRCRRRGILPPIDLVAYIGYELSRALEYAHTRCDDHDRPLNIIHRDVSPPNVLIGIQGEIKLTDFGVAKTDVREALTRPGVLRGKYAYMSPEQVRHRPMDHRSDIFSLGIVLYEALTGVNPFEGSTDYQTMESVERAEVEPAGFLRPDTPAELDRILLACLEPDADLRYQDATELRRDLAAVVRSLGADDGPDRMRDFLRDIFPERAPESGEEGDDDESPVLPWEGLAHRLAPMLVSIPRSLTRRPPEAAAAAPTPAPEPPATPPVSEQPAAPVATATPEPLDAVTEPATPPVAPSVRARREPPPEEPAPDPAPDLADVPADEPSGPTFREVGLRARRPVAAVMEWVEGGTDPDRILTEPGVDVPFLPHARGEPERPIKPVVQLGPSDVVAPGESEPASPAPQPLLTPADLLPPEAETADLARTDDGVPIFNEWDLEPEPGQPVEPGQRTAPSAVRVQRRPIVLNEPAPEPAPMQARRPRQPPPEAPAPARRVSAPAPRVSTPSARVSTPASRVSTPAARVSTPAAAVPSTPPSESGAPAEASESGTDPSARRPRAFTHLGPSALWTLAAVLIPLLLLGGMNWLDQRQAQATVPSQPLLTEPNREDDLPLQRLDPLPPTRPGAPASDDG